MKTITTAQEVAYLRTLADTGNATLAAVHAGVSRDWAYKKREQDAGFAELCREMAALARARLPRRVNRGRKGGWTAEKEALFLERLEDTCSVPCAAFAVRLSAKSAYERRKVRPDFAAAWAEALRNGWPPAEQPWLEAALCLLDGEPVPPDNPVRITSVSDVLQAMKGNKFVPRGPRGMRE